MQQPGYIQYNKNGCKDTYLEHRTIANLEACRYKRRSEYQKTLRYGVSATSGYERNVVEILYSSTWD
jgi:endonuclease I